MLTPEQEYSRVVACSLRDIGLNPLPSRLDFKSPWLDRYTHLWETQAPDELFTPEGWPPTTNLQLMTGRAWRLIAFDLDGPKAVEEWDRIRGPRSLPPTWVTCSGGGSGRKHIWFRLPAGWETPLPKGDIWWATYPERRVKGVDAIERLCDKSLVMFPPSIHPRTGMKYGFANPKHKPPQMILPAVAPDWVLELKPARPPVRPPAHITPEPPRKVRFDGSGPRLTAKEILDRIPDKVSIVASWGIRFAGQERDSGWVPCRAFDRDDRNPSAAFHRDLGRYYDSGSGQSLSLFDLAVAMGRAHDFEDARDRLMEYVR